MRKKGGSCGCNKSGGSILGRIGKTLKKTLKSGVNMTKNAYSRIKGKVFRNKTFRNKTRKYRR
jgi:lactate dehydrogenase-like 2-hydroxyacid dehydrogenase